MNKFTKKEIGESSLHFPDEKRTLQWMFFFIGIGVFTYFGGIFPYINEFNKYNTITMEKEFLTIGTLSYQIAMFFLGVIMMVIMMIYYEEKFKV